MSWHPDPALLKRYAAQALGPDAPMGHPPHRRGGALDHVVTASVEAHLASCGTCRAALPVDEGWLDASWAMLADRVMPPRLRLTERILRRLGVSETAARLTATPSMAGRAWLVAVMVVFAGAVLLARAAVGTVPVSWLLIVAPLSPLAGVAVVYGRPSSPIYELEMASPTDAFRILLFRSAAVTATALCLALVADLLAPSVVWTGAWLVPSLALTAATLALGAWMALSSAAMVMTVLWAAIVATTLPQGQAAAFGALSQGIYLAILALAAGVLVRHWQMFDQGEIR